MLHGIAKPARTLLLAMAFCFAGAAAAWAKSEVVVVDTLTIWNETKAGQDVQSQLDSFTKKRQDALEAERAEFQKKVDDLRAKKESLQISEPVFAQKFRELQAEEREFQQRRQESTTQIRIAAGRARTQFLDAIRPTLESVMKKHKGKVLMERTSLLVTTDQVDATQEAIKAIDKKLTELKVDLNPPKAEEPAKP